MNKKNYVTKEWYNIEKMDINKMYYKTIKI